MISSMPSDSNLYSIGKTEIGATPNTESFDNDPTNRATSNSINSIEYLKDEKQDVFDSSSQLEKGSNHSTKEWKKFFEIFICGVALISDGYCSNSIGTVMTILKKLYPKETTNNKSIQDIGVIAYVGTVVGQLSFGWYSDFFGRKNGMITATLILIISTALCAGAYGYHGSISGMLSALIAYRFFLGIGIGAEYPCGSVAASENSNQMKSGRRHGSFIFVTNAAVDLGLALGAFVPYILVCIFGDHHLKVVWRMSIGLGCVIPIILFLFRLPMKENNVYLQSKIPYSKIPWSVVLHLYGIRFLVICIVWFTYDLSTFAFSLYSSTIVSGVLPHNASIAKSFGWNTLINSFPLPGSWLGCIFSDIIGPKWCLVSGLILQGAIGFFMSGFYNQLVHHIAGFCVIYGIFLTLGEFGPGGSIGLIASKTSPTAIRGIYYGLAAAIGKCGAITGVYVFGGNEIQVYFYAASGIALFVAILVFFFLPHISQTCVEDEDKRFVEACIEAGYGNPYDYEETYLAKA
ncbi:glycerophosphodiester transporter [Schizosaccharomyces cryophilus OY26]|uniref:Glycerophosphodiester transporter n=1 Tax=Schizosaccharomyces cryophilus (strain OY26 / ATCC MYA-4695 / CBS 11777 / NBRC 106824 / NRRL Y48691) TaxID=653667 RepID=S9XEQ5_SCHCR|nr:glycerophosphodiester transporter [Schizosaccharomyces cryophilus OY26]EPY52266.1 glycerophosphodiester transporter [Schizosaccharomyces cryophilus OY26]